MRAATLLIGTVAAGCSLVVDPPRFDIDTSVSVNPAGDHEEPAIAVRADGIGLVAWKDDANDTPPDVSETSIVGRMWADGAPTGPELAINTTYAGVQQTPHVAASPAGFLVVWSDHSGSTQDPSAAIRARAFDAAGAALGDDFVVNTFTTLDQVDAAAVGLPDGTFVVVWTDTNSTRPGDIRVRRIDVSGVGAPEMTATSSDLGDQQHSDVALNEQANAFMIAWEGADAAGTGIFARGFRIDGTPLGSDVQINTTTAGNQTEPSVTALGNSFLVTWVDEGLSGSVEDIRGQIVVPDATRVGPELAINTVVAGSQDDVRAAGGPLGALVVWTDDSLEDPDRSEGGVRARRVAIDGTFPESDDSLLNQITFGNQEAPSVSLTGTTYVVVWEDGSQTSPFDDDALRARVIDATQPLP